MAKTNRGRPRIVDTNVPIVANGKSPQASDTCVENCIAAILDITRHGGLVLDDEDVIFGEYLKHLSFSGHPGPGDAFMKWVHDHRCDEKWCERVSLHKLGQSDTDFQEFPVCPELESFDPSDRKFVAVAVAHGGKPDILEALDTGWWYHREALKKSGIAVTFVCEADIKRLATRGSKYQ